jgi:hypothetical protein
MFAPTWIAEFPAPDADLQYEADLM